MRRPAILLALTFTGLVAAPARAGQTRCWVDHGVVVVSAALGDIAGDFILDLSAPQSQLHLTRAQGDGIDAASLTAPLALAGERIPATLAIVNLDAPTWGFDTTINGVIGWDVLAPYVVDLQLAPCRLTLWPGRPPPLKGPFQRLPIQALGGVPTLSAAVFDGRRGAVGRFAIDTGSAGVRLSDADAALSRSPAGVDPTSRQTPPARLAALGLGDEVLRNLPAGLESQTPPGLLGGLGDAVWSRYALRIDARRGWLELSPPRP